MPMAARSAAVMALFALLALVLCFITAGFAKASEDPTKNLTLYGEITLMLTMFLCGFVGAKCAAENRFASGVCASGMLLVLVIVASLFLGGNAFLKSAILATLSFAISATGAAIGSRQTKRKHRR